MQDQHVNPGPVPRTGIADHIAGRPDFPLDHPNQYRATIMIAITRTDAISKSRRSSDFGRSFALERERMTQLPLKSIVSGAASLGKGQSMTVSGMTKQASFFERVGSLLARRHFAGLLESIQCAGILVAAVSRGFTLHDVRP